MGAFKYQTKIGDYNDPVVLGIDLKVEGGLSTADYEKIKVALDLLEKTALFYRDAYDVEAVDADSEGAESSESKTSQKASPRDPKEKVETDE